ncbi:MAG: ribonucleoside triphosphate reductase [Clostridia bacterium]|nr:ribonucleoside triphosphate reductase [Clostridia bacterium]
MISTIIKRDGSEVRFEQEKITKAIKNAIMNVYDYDKDEKFNKLAEVLSDKVLYKLDNRYSEKIIPNIEDVQDVVEDVLIESGEKEAVKHYVKYRYVHENIREGKKAFVDVLDTFDRYVDQAHWRVRENSNMGYSLQGLNNHIVSEVTKEYWLNKIYDETIREKHLAGDFHIHDLGLFASYCCGWSLEDLLTRGFSGVRGKIESKAPRHFRTALLQLVNFFYTLQGEAAGAQAVSSFDTYLAPFIRKDGLNYKQVKQAMQEFVFNLNVPTRVGFQTPFVNLTMDLECPKMLANEPVIIGGERKDTTFGEYQEEMDMINRAFAEVMMEGDAKGRIFTFPIPTYNISKDFDWDREGLDLVFEMTAKYGIPYFANFINSDMSPEDARSMCCRLRLDNRELRKRGGGLFGANPLTGSIGVVTINMPRLGYVSKSEEEFFERLNHLMECAKNSLETKRKVVEQSMEMGLYPYSKYYLDTVYERFGCYWKNHFSTIGLNGMNECIRNFFGDKEDITTEKGQEFSVKVLDFMREIIMGYQEETGNLYNLEATPAEGTGYRLAKMDVEKYPEIITAGGKTPYYTNSTQLPVGHTVDIFEAIDLQDALQTRYTGGTVLHGFLGERIEDIEVVKNLIKKVFTNYELPYFTISPTFSICPEHGYINGEKFKCPECDADTEVWTRVVGFHRPVHCWNDGKQMEYEERKEFVV